MTIKTEEEEKEEGGESKEETPETTPETPEEEGEEGIEEEDAEALLDAEKKKDERLEKLRYKKTHLEKEEKRLLGEDIEDDDDKPMTRREARELVQSTLRSSQSSQIESLIRSRAKSNAEAELIRFFYDKRIQPTGDIAEDVDSAYALAFKKKIKRERNEAILALENKGQDKSRGAGQKIPKEKVRGPNQDERNYLTQMGYKNPWTFDNGDTWVEKPTS